MVAPVIGAAGIGAAAGLFQQLMAAEQAKQAQAHAEQMAREEAERQRLRQAEQNQLQTVKDMGQGEQSAINNLMAVLMRTAR